MSHSTITSKQMFDRACAVMIEGGSSASRGPANYGEYPLFIESGQGAMIRDVDGNEYIDWMMAYGALPLGHAHSSVTAAVTQAAETGCHFATATEIEIEVAEILLRMVPGADKVRFANTGTEATMAAIRLARGYTGKPKFIKFEGHYHGWYDDFLVNSNPQLLTSLGHVNDPVKIIDSSGLNRHAVDDTIVLPWNNIEAVERVLKASSGEIAAVISEGIMANMGVVPPAPGYLQALQKLCRDHDVLFILDETVTGLRIAAGGCQELYDLDPDISTFGKALGCGLPVAAMLGKSDIMAALEWGGVLHYGTQNGSRIGLHATKACLEILNRDNGAAFRRIWDVADQLSSGLTQLFQASDTPALVQNVGPMLQIMFTEEETISDYRQYCQFVDRHKYQLFARALFREGVYMTPSPVLHSIVTLAHDPQHVQKTLEAVKRVLAG